MQKAFVKYASGWCSYGNGNTLRQEYKRIMIFLARLLHYDNEMKRMIFRAV